MFSKPSVSFLSVGEREEITPSWICFCQEYDNTFFVTSYPKQMVLVKSACFEFLNFYEITLLIHRHIQIGWELRKEK